MSYNGWANWETWNVALWVDNEEWSYNAKRAWFRHNPARVTAENCRLFIAEYYPDGTPDMDSPREMDKVDWEEIAENWASELEEA